ncbi:homocysteine S-methyltransferase [Jannaschia faecimaris]|uniref:Homocysteine S-methyltransferase n=1 Tax=Jannaschia faecimaris TaxID=1244108 RepID=A0A1H3R0A8_9RHOB|nr:homocysteine S-methyltransferase family protein [Jannaschia faecimaris]SDZ18943.1 homocysteine S-methyltransferase [Jannaschia faecimaris]
MTNSNLLSNDRVWISWTGMETDLIFNKGYDLPNFAAFPMIDSAEGRDMLARYYEDLIAIGRETGTGIILDTPTWMANPDRAKGVGYEAADLPRVTHAGVALARSVSDSNPDVATRVSVQIGPRGDGYEPGLSAAEASANYHAPQIDAAREAGADMVSAYTLGATGEAIGISTAAKRAGIPALISFTVETDGKLADGTSLASAVANLAEAAEPAAIMVNCAHPDHIAHAFDGGEWEAMLTGVIANASRQSHAELDDCEVLDDGDPDELGRQLADMRRARPGLRILGGCCGTDLRHLRAAAESVTG